ncbi:MAG: zinc-binding alcohol dehydrogenase [Granulosicoccus sp.]
MTLARSTTEFWINARESGELREAELPAPKAEELRIRTLFTGISRGTETLVFSGQVPESEHQRMRAPFQSGEFTFPVKYGYMNVGRVEQGPKHLQGQSVFCLFPHQTRYNVPVDAVTLLPPDVPPERAVLAANMETAINALWDARPCIGDKISVVGAGVLGSLVAYLASRITGCEVQLIDINARRASVADALGVEFSEPQNALGERDLVIHTSATQQGLNSALGLAGFEATVLELSWYGNRQIAVNLGGAFHSQRLQLNSSQVGHVAREQRSRWSYQRRLQFALCQLGNPALDVLISGESHFSDLPQTLEWLSRPDNTSLCHRITYDYLSPITKK